MTKAYSHSKPEGEPTGEIVLLAFPLDSYILLTTEAAKRNKTVVQAIQEAVSNWVIKK